MTSSHYKAFISYSHRDESWARWLQHSLEKYRVPKRLVGTQGAFGPIPARLNPVFRDREDLSSASDLTSQIKGELANSETIIVICSPTAAASRWVAEEIRYFRQLGQGERTLALIVDGDPQASDPTEACFSPALLEMPDGSSKEPLAADVRKYADGKRLSLLKIVAGILGIRLDELRRRDAQRQTRNRVVYSLVSMLLVSVISWLVYIEEATRASAQAQRTNTEELLGYMLGDLKRLAPIKGLELVVADDENQQKFRQELDFEKLDEDELIEKSLQWRGAGIEYGRLGDFEAAMGAYQQSRAAIIELHQREGDTPRALFELGQAEYYVGEIYLRKGEMDLAEEAWARYGAVTRRLVNAEPNNATYVMELSYTLMNLGAVEQSRPNPDASKSLPLIQASIQYNQMALVLDPANLTYRDELVTAFAWLADAWLLKCELGNAFDSRKQSVDLRRELALEHPEEPKQRQELAYTLTGLARVQQKIGLNDAAISSFEEARDILQLLHQDERDNTYLEWELLYRTELLARLLQAMGRTEEAWELIGSIANRMLALSGAADGTDHLMSIDAAFFRLDYGKLMLERGDIEPGKALIKAAAKDLTELVRQKPGFRESLIGLAYAYFAYWQQFGNESAHEIENLLDGYLSAPAEVENCTDANQAARLAIIDGNEALAKHYTDYVLGKGYFEAGFISFCKEYNLCDLP
jgi:tetratricopeptide (TPR) repeat protein